MSTLVLPPKWCGVEHPHAAHEWVEPSGMSGMYRACPGSTSDRHDQGHSWPTVATVDLMLQQLRLDRDKPYWSELPQRDYLDGAQAWLLSLRDWLENTTPLTPGSEKP